MNILTTGPLVLVFCVVLSGISVGQSKPPTTILHMDRYSFGDQGEVNSLITNLNISIEQKTDSGGVFHEMTFDYVLRTEAVLNFQPKDRDFLQHLFHGIEMNIRGTVRLVTGESIVKKFVEGGLQRGKVVLEGGDDYALGVSISDGSRVQIILSYLPSECMMGDQTKPVTQKSVIRWNPQEPNRWWNPKVFNIYDAGKFALFQYGGGARALKGC